VLATPLLMSPILVFLEMSVFELNPERCGSKQSRYNLATHFSSTLLIVLYLFCSQEKRAESFSFTNENEKILEGNTRSIKSCYNLLAQDTVQPSVPGSSPTSTTAPSSQRPG
jgi:hypothetical protein